MHKFTDRIELCTLSDSLLNEVFNGFYIMIGGALNLFNARRLIEGKVIHQLI